MKNELKIELIRRMTRYLEDACAYHATGERELFHYSTGKATAIRDLLEDFCAIYESDFSEHIRNMWEITDEEW